MGIIDSDASDQRRSVHQRSRWVPVTLLTLGLLLLGVAWVFGNAPGASPDEPATYTKAIATAYGDFIPRPVAPAPKGATGPEVFDADSIGFFVIPTRLVADPRWGCATANIFEPATCLTKKLPRAASAPTSKTTAVSTYVAYYPPLVFGLTGLIARLGTHAIDALYLGRMADLVVSIVMLCFAFALSKGRWQIVALLAATSPMVIFLAGSFNPSGVEVAAGIAFAVVICDFCRGSSSKLTWWAFAICGCVLSTARPFGPLWVIADGLLLLAVIGPSRLVRLCTRPTGRMRGACWLVALASIFTVVWDLFVSNTPHGSISTVIHDIGPSISQLRAMVDQFPGVFGWADVSMPQVTVNAALALYALILLAGFITARGLRKRIVLVGFLAVSFIIAVGTDAAVQIPFNFGVQARYVMPLSAMALLFSGYMLDERLRNRYSALGQRRSIVGLRERFGLGVLPILLAAALVAFQVEGWLWNTHAYADGRSGPWSFLSHPGWVPPIGWNRLLGVMVAGVILMMSGVLWLMRSEMTSARLTRDTPQSRTEPGARSAQR
jgi:Predicted membrane protein (DUF2142)